MFDFIKYLTAGVVIGLLVAPEKGRDTRRKIANLFTDLTDDATSLAERTGKGARRAIDKASDRLEEEFN